MASRQVNLGSKITTAQLSKSMMQKWNTIRPILKYDHTNNIEEVKPVYAEKYKFDLYGLFREVFSIPEEFLYPHMIVNDYDCPTDFTGERLRFRKLDANVLQGYYRRFLSS